MSDAQLQVLFGWANAVRMMDGVLETILAGETLICERDGEAVFRQPTPEERGSLQREFRPSPLTMRSQSCRRY
jgi:hypothetical protein